MKEKILRANKKYHAKVEKMLLELAEVPEEMLNRMPSEGGWTAIQTAWHLLLVEETSMGYVQKKLGYGGSFKKVGLNERWRMLLLSLALFSPIKFKAPKASGRDSLPTHATFSDLNTRWHKVRLVWTDFLSELPDSLADKAVFKHPRAGKIGWVQMLNFFETHLDRHHRQIRKALL